MVHISLLIFTLCSVHPFLHRRGGRMLCWAPTGRKVQNGSGQQVGSQGRFELYFHPLPSLFSPFPPIPVHPYLSPVPFPRQADSREHHKSSDGGAGLVQQVWKGSMNCVAVGSRHYITDE